MPTHQSQSGFTYRNGHLRIAEGAIHIETEKLRPLKRHYQYHRIIVGGMGLVAIYFALSIPIGIIFDPGVRFLGYDFVSRDRAIRDLIIFGIPIAAIIAVNLFQSTYTLETPIGLDRVDYVLAQPAKHVRSPILKIVYDDESKIRQLPMDMRGFGDKQQFEKGKSVIRANGIPLKEERR